MKILALDPGSDQTAFCIMEGQPLDKGILPNDQIKKLLLANKGVDILAIEFINYGYHVGREIFETVYWCGRWAEYAEVTLKLAVKRIARQKAKSYLSGMPTCNDTVVRGALLAKYGGIKKGQPLYGFSKDMWAALCIADYVKEASKIGNLEEW